MKAVMLCGDGIWFELEMHNAPPKWSVRRRGRMSDGTISTEERPYEILYFERISLDTAGGVAVYRQEAEG